MKIGFYRRSRKSNKRLITLFEKNQKARISAKWNERAFWNKLSSEEKEIRKEVLKMLKDGEIQTSDDFYRAAFILHHGKDFTSYALAVALAATSNHLGEPWGKGLYAAALDRFLLSIGQTQYFGTQFEKEGKKWVISKYNEKTTDEERKFYLVGSMEDILKDVKKMNEE